MFLAGDAAHIHSPFGGQGMNTGLQDAWNLAWKVDFALRNWGNDWLLDSYSEERHLIAQRVIETTDLLTRAMSVANRPAQAVRNLAFPVLTRIEPFVTFFVSTLSELGVRLSESPIVIGGGARAEDEAVGPFSTPLYRMIGNRYLLLYPAAANSDARSTLAAFAAEYGGAVSTVQASGPFMRLVRPDAYIAWEGEFHARELENTIARIRSVLDGHLHRRPEPALRMTSPA
jgi:hypothetical protein